MNTKRLSLVLIIFMAALTIQAGCAKKRERHIPHDAARFATVEELAEHFLMMFHEGDPRAVLKEMIDGMVYVTKYHPHTPEAKVPDAMPAEAFWKELIAGERMWNVKRHCGNYKGTIKAFLGVGKPKKVTQIGPYTFLRRIPITFEAWDYRGKVHVITDKNILGVVIKDGDDYMLLNVFE